MSLMKHDDDRLGLRRVDENAPWARSLPPPLLRVVRVGTNGPARVMFPRFSSVWVRSQHPML